jgi:hypothetical protein
VTRGRHRPEWRPRGARLHLVTTIVGGDVMTKCGRRMAVTPAYRAPELSVIINPQGMVYAGLLCQACDSAKPEVTAP